MTRRRSKTSIIKVIQILHITQKEANYMLKQQKNGSSEDCNLDCEW